VKQTFKMVKGGVVKIAPLHKVAALKRLGYIEEVEGEVEEVKGLAEKFTVKELKEKCKERGISGYSDKNQSELVEMLEGAGNGE